jgi:integrase
MTGYESIDELGDAEGLALRTRRPAMSKRGTIKTIEQRSRLEHRAKPYWHRIDGLRGAALGFRKHAARSLQSGGAWVLRYRVDGKYLEHGFAEADNAKMPPNGSTVLSFEQAINRARALYSERTAAEFVAASAPPARPSYTVAECCRDYVRDLERRRKKFADASLRLEALVIPWLVTVGVDTVALGDVVLEELSARQIRDWMHALHASKPRARSPMSGKVRRYRSVDEADDDYARRRAATVNRTWAYLRAALNLAFRDDKLRSLEFLKVKPLKVGDRTVNRAHCRPIEPEEMDEFLAAVAPEGADFEHLVLVALYSGCRYGELGRLRVGDYDRKHGTLYVRPGKTGYDRLVRVIPEGRALLERLTKGRRRDEFLLMHDIVTGDVDGSTRREPWGNAHQGRHMGRVLERCPLEGVSFKATRDTFGTWLLAAGVPLVVISEQLGHRSVEITRKHYVKILERMNVEATRAAERIRIVGGAEILDLDTHRATQKRVSA